MKKKTLFVLLIVASVVNGFIIVNAVMDLNATLYAATYFGLFSGMKEFATYLIYNNEVSSKFFAIKNWGDIIADIIEIIYLLFIEVMEICFIRRLQRNSEEWQQLKEDKRKKKIARLQKKIIELDKKDD